MGTLPQSETQLPPNQPPNSSTTTLDSPDEPNETLPPLSVWREYIDFLIVSLIMAIFGMTFILQPVRVPTGSMLNTILIGDYFLVNKFIFGLDQLNLDSFTPHRPIQRGDVIVFKYPGNPNINYVKRVIGLPGETIQIKGSQVFINGQLLPEHYLIAQQPNDPAAPLVLANSQPSPQQLGYTVYYSPQTVAANADLNPYPLPGQRYAVSAPFTIPNDSFFAMGDNRDGSEDSRYWGVVPKDNIIGKPFIIYYSLDSTKAATTKAPPSPLSKIIPNIRWSRLGTIIK